MLLEDANAVKRSLLDAGCTEQSAGFVNQLYQPGRLRDALHALKVIRCDRMDELHQSQKKVDCLDYLIRQTEKEIKTTSERR